MQLRMRLRIRTIGMLWFGVVNMVNAAPQCLDCGRVESIRSYEVKGEGSGAGAVIGGVAGGVAGHQFGGGRGKDALTVVGAVGGAYAGHQTEKHLKRKTYWEVKLHMDAGETKAMNFPTKPTVEVGDRVKIVKGKLALLAE